MSYIGNVPTTAAFPFDQFSGTGAATSFTLTYAPASATSILVAISGVMQNPNLYSVIGTTLSFSPAPPTGTNNISVLYLGLPVIGSSSPGNTAFLSATDLTATAGQTVFASAGSYTPGFVRVYRNGARLGNADFTATNGTTITLASAATAGDLVTIEYYTLTSLVNALPLTGGTVTGSTTFNSAVTINGASASGFTGMKNRIINGNMVVDQRNAGASISLGSSPLYAVDRFESRVAQGSGHTGQRVSTAPVGFNNSLKITIGTGGTPTAGQNTFINQQIEGFNFADLGWGTANAQTITVSFMVYSSLTGTFAYSIANNALNRSYVATYSIPVANTWTAISLTIPGDTSGTWVGATNGIGSYNFWDLGSGSDKNGTAGAWQAVWYTKTSATVNVAGTSGATFYITGVQLERGSNATSFEFIDYGRQLIQCQRYAYGCNMTMGNTYSAGNSYGHPFKFPVTMRSTPSLASGAIFTVNAGSAGTPSILVATGAPASPDGVFLYNNSSNWTVGAIAGFTGVFTAEL